MTQNQFIEVMTELVSLKRNVEACRAAFKKLDPDFAFFSLGTFEMLVTKTIKIAVDDKDDLVSYWLYDLDCGAKWKKGTVTDKEGKDIPIKTLGQLYKCIKN